MTVGYKDDYKGDNQTIPCSLVSIYLSSNNVGFPPHSINLRQEF